MSQQIENSNQVIEHLVDEEVFGRGISRGEILADEQDDFLVVEDSKARRLRHLAYKEGPRSENS